MMIYLYEKYNNLTYSSKANVYFNPQKISNFFGEKGIVFANPKKITLVFFPILYDNNKIKLFNENVFFREWNKTLEQSELINFIIPIEDIEELNEHNKTLEEEQEESINELDEFEKEFKNSI